MCAGSAGVQVEDLTIRQTKSRDPGAKRWSGDGHWGVQNGNSVDVLVHKFDIQPNMLHCVGSDGFGMFAVFSQGKMDNGNLELHRWVQGRTHGLGGLAGWEQCSLGAVATGSQGAAETLHAGAAASAAEP